MTKVEFLTRLFEANKARELSYITILHMTMRAKRTENPANVDQVSLIKTLQEMTEIGTLQHWMTKTKPHVDAAEWQDTPVWVMIG